MRDNRLTVVISYIGRIGGSLASLPATVLIARMLSPQDFGSYTLAFTIVLFGSLLGPLNIGQSALRFVSAARGLCDLATARRVALQCVGIGMASLLVVSGALALLHVPIRSLLPNLPAGTMNGMLVASWLCATGMVILLGGALRSLDKIELGILVEVTLSRVLLLVAQSQRLYLAKCDSLTAVLAASAATTGAVAIFAAIAFLKSLPTVIPSPAANSYHVTPKNLLGLAFPLLGVQLLYRIIVDGPFWLVGSFCSSDAVERFGAAYRLWAFFCLPQAAINSVIEGKIGQLHVRGKDQLEPVARSAAALALYPTVLGTLVLALIGKPLLRITFGEFYASGESYLLVLCLFQIVSTFPRIERISPWHDRPPPDGVFQFARRRDSLSGVGICSCSTLRRNGCRPQHRHRNRCMATHNSVAGLAEVGNQKLGFRASSSHPISRYRSIRASK